MDDERPEDSTDDNVLVFRNSASEPVVVPQRIALAEDEIYQAYQEHLAGESWDLIAAKHGYINAAAARAAVARYADEARNLLSTHTRRHLLATEVARLDALQAVVWSQAMKGHLPAVKVVLDLVMCRVKVLGLDQGTEADDPAGSPTTVVIDADDYEAGLRRAVES